MSKDIIIQKNGVDQELNGATKLVTSEYGGLQCTWVPEDERQHTEKTVTKNGEYAAEDDGFYAYSRVTVAIGIDLPYTGTTSGGVNYTIYLDNKGKPHLVIHGRGET